MQKRIRKLFCILPSFLLAVSLSCAGVMAEESSVVLGSTEDIIVENEFTDSEDTENTGIIEIASPEELETEQEEIIEGIDEKAEEMLDGDNFSDNAAFAVGGNSDGGGSQATAAKISVAPGTDQDVRDNYTVYSMVDENHIWHQFTTSGNDSYYYIGVAHVDGGSYSTVQLKDENGIIKWKKSNLGVGNSQKVYYTWIKLKTNTTYYFESYSQNKKSGKLSYCVAESVDDAPNEKTKAVSCKLGVEYSKRLDAEYDIDWFSFQTGSDDNAEYKLTCTASGEIPELCDSGDYGYWFDLYDSDFETVAEIKHVPRKKTVEKTVELSANSTYYLKVHSGDGSIGGMSKIFGGYKFSLEKSKNAIDISGAEITLDKTVYTYKKSKTYKPAIKKVTLYVDGKTVTLKKSDYELDENSYSYNDEVGTAMVTIYGKGDYCGHAFAFFTIKPGKPTGVKLKQIKSGLIVSWDKCPGVEKFEYRYAVKKSKLKKTDEKVFSSPTSDEQEYELFSKGKRNYRTLNGLKAKTKYYVQVRFYANGEYSDWSDVKSEKTK